MNRRDRKAAVAKAKAEGMNRRDRKALGRKLKAESMEEFAYPRKRKSNLVAASVASAREDLLRSDDWQAVGQRKQDLIEGLRRFNESETAAQLKTRPYRDRAYSELTSGLRKGR